MDLRKSLTMETILRRTRNRITTDQSPRILSSNRLMRTPDLFVMSMVNPCLKKTSKDASSNGAQNATAGPLRIIPVLIREKQMERAIRTFKPITV
jgi:hypothetical protein